MKRTRRAALAALVMCLTAPHSSSLVAQAPAARSGLLLGMRDCALADCAPLGTYWIVREGDRVRIAASGRGLAVPRRDGFWWVGAEEGAIPDQPSADTVVCRDSLTEAAANVDTLGAASTVWAAPAATRAIRESPTGGMGDVTIDWVSGEWLAFTETTSAPDHEHFSTTRHIVPLGLIASGDRDLLLHQYYPSGKALERAVAMCTPSLAREDGISGGVEWSVLRRPNRWAMFGTFVSQSFEAADIPNCVLPAEITASVLGPDRVTVPWSAIKDVLPGAVLAVESPTADLLLVQQDGSWYAFFPRARTTGPVVARFELRGRPVMTQWATGAYVARWTSALTPMLAAGPPALPDPVDPRK